MKYRALMVCALLIAGCSAGNMPGYDGIYTYEGLYGVNYTLNLQSDSTFRLYWQTGLDHGVTNGNWVKKRGYIILNDDSSPGKVLNVTEWSVPQFDSIKIYFENPDGIPLGLVSVALNDSCCYVADDHGRLFIERMKLNTIGVDYLGLAIPKYLVVNDSSNHFRFKIKDTMDQRLYLNHTKLSIKGNKLISPKGGLNNNIAITLHR